VSNKSSIVFSNAEGLSTNFLEASWAEVEADISTRGEDVAWSTLFAMESELICVLAIYTVGWAVATALCGFVVPLVISTCAEVDWFSV